MNAMRRRILNCRSERDKFALPADLRRCPPGSREELARMIDDGLAVWLDRAVVTEYRMLCDIYILTPAGIALCEAEGIEQH